VNEPLDPYLSSCNVYLTGGVNGVLTVDIKALTKDRAVLIGSNGDPKNPDMKNPDMIVVL
jgi:hypothetical protein